MQQARPDPNDGNTCLTLQANRNVYSMAVSPAKQGERRNELLDRSLPRMFVFVVHGREYIKKHAKPGCEENAALAACFVGITSPVVVNFPPDCSE